MGRPTAVVLTLFGLTVACTRGGGPEAQLADPETVRASLMEADRAWAAEEAASDTPFDELAERIVDDVRVLAPDMPIARGREACLAVFAALGAMPGFSLSWNPTEALAGGGGDLGVTIGTYRMEFEDPDGHPVAIDGKYMTLWTRRDDGSWGVAADMFNADGPPTPVAN